MAEVGLGSQYELCQLEVLKSGPMPQDELNKELTNIGAWFSSNMGTHYYMLLNNELHDYTIFNFMNYNFAQGVKELREVLDSRGVIYKIEFNHENNYFELWVVNGEEAHMYLLFPCGDFVIDIR